MHTIRHLEVGEAALYREVRLEALRESPDAFATSYESALNRDHESWVAQADGSAEGGDRATFVVLADRPVGLAALYRDSEDPFLGDLIQMWVAPGHRGGAVAVGLLDRVFDWASRHGFRSIRAEVTAGNSRAFRFYEKYGFRPSAGCAGGSLLSKEVVSRSDPPGAADEVG